MNADNLNKWLSLAANLGVIVGIIFLAIEISQNNEALESQSRAAWIDRQVSLSEAIAFNPELIEILLKDPTEYSPIEINQIIMLGYRTLTIWEFQFDEIQLGRIDENDAVGLMVGVWHFVDGNLGTQFSWPSYKSGRAKPEFIDWFENNVVNADISGLVGVN